MYRCEVLWAGRLSPFAAVGDLPELDAVRLVNVAAKLLRANLHHAETITVPGVKGGPAVYGRNGQPCQRCGETIESRAHGAHGQTLYWCPGCQVRLDPRRPGEDTPTWIRTRPPSASSTTSPGAEPAEDRRDVTGGLTHDGLALGASRARSSHLGATSRSLTYDAPVTSRPIGVHSVAMASSTFMFDALYDG